MQDKIKTFEELTYILKEKKDKKIVQCHGVFDLLHPGHIKHLKKAKEQGNILVVSITADKFVNKGPGRPVFNHKLRAETLSSMSCVDYVVINEEPDAINAIKKIKPSIYFKGIEYKTDKDVTGKISQEVTAVQSVGGKIQYSKDITFSSSKLLNKYFQPPSEKTIQFIERLKKSYSLNEIIEKIEDFANLNVLVIGDAIIDKYQYVSSLGQSGKGTHMVASLEGEDIFLGGSLIIANHISQFTNQVTLLSGIGSRCRYKDFIDKNLASHVEKNFLFFSESTLVKKRYIIKEGKNLTKLFETYGFNDFCLSQKNISDFMEYIEKEVNKYDVVIVADFANGFMNKQMIKSVSKIKPFLAINTQINSGNRGYNVITHYDRADYISLNEPEVRLAAHEKTKDLSSISCDILKKLQAKYISVTRGINGAQCFNGAMQMEHIPAFVEDTIDRVGAGDSYFALSALSFAKKNPMILSGLIGSLASALDVQIIGNKEHIKKEALLKFLIRLMK